MQLSLCMIVRDNQEIIEECLLSIRPWVDEMIVVDTGSTDRTAELAAALGAGVSRFSWIDDFSAARNESLKRARGEWLFWMDSDDVIDEQNGRRLKAVAEAAHAPSTLGHVMQVHCPGPGGAAAGDLTVVDHVKLFRNRPDLRFEGRIHEQILPAIRRAGGDVAWTDIYVEHKHGAVSPAGKARKCARDLRILELDIAERGEHPFVLFNLGMTYAEMDEPASAAAYLQRSIAASGPDESHLRKAYGLLIPCLLQTERASQAAAAFDAAIRCFPDDPEIRFRGAVLAHQQGRRELAIQRYAELLRLGPPGSSGSARCFSSRDTGVAGHKARHNMAIVYSELERWDQAELQWRSALADAPDFSRRCSAWGRRLSAKTS